MVKTTEVKMRSLGIVFCSLLLFCACNSKSVFQDSISFNNAEWSKDSVVRFSVEVTDTLKSYDVVFSITNNDDYPYANLFLFTDVIFPSHKYLRDTVEFILSSTDGEWLGTGMNGYTNDFQFKTNVRFPEVGTYIFAFEQAMRCKNDACSVAGIKSVSLSVNKK